MLRRRRRAGIFAAVTSICTLPTISRGRSSKSARSACSAATTSLTRRAIRRSRRRSWNQVEVCGVPGEVEEVTVRPRRRLKCGGLSRRNMAERELGKRGVYVYSPLVVERPAAGDGSPVNFCTRTVPAAPGADIIALALERAKIRRRILYVRELKNID